MDELERFNEKVERENVKFLSKLRDSYQYAREKGFTSTEARLLSHTSRAKIDRLIALKAKR